MGHSFIRTGSRWPSHSLDWSFSWCREMCKKKKKDVLWEFFMVVFFGYSNDVNVALIISIEKDRNLSDKCVPWRWHPPFPNRPPPAFSRCCLSWSRCGSISVIVIKTVWHKMGVEGERSSKMPTGRLRQPGDVVVIIFISALVHPCHHHPASCHCCHWAWFSLSSLPLQYICQTICP